VLVLGERDCSIQRRHQKVVEEAPAPFLPDPRIRGEMHEAARRAAKAIDYWGAGTVEFLLDPEGDRFFFLEMNTRLQVEHPVTEAVFGVDLVEMQLDVAEGQGFSPLVLAEIEKRTEDQSEDHLATQPNGHAIEARLYAEDPAADFQPQSGLLTTFEIPVENGIRVDTGFETGNEVSTHYDAMLAKVIAHAPTRLQAARLLATTLRRARIHGVVTNRDLLVDILRSRDFIEGDGLSTAFLVDRTSEQPATDPGAPVAAALALAERAGSERSVQRGIPVAWRNVVSQPQVTEFEGDVRVEWLHGRNGYAVDGFTVVAASAVSVTLEVDSVRTVYDVAVSGDVVDVDSATGHLKLFRVPRFVDPADAVASGSLLAPMPGTVISVAVQAGQSVESGQTVLVLEAMKMQHTVTAPRAGVVTEIDVRPGAQVAAGEVLAVVEETGAER
ncbi:MAG: biotin/lipoyl-containing protein, partial [Nocardioides sp.]